MTIRELRTGTEQAMTKGEYDAIRDSDPRPWPERPVDVTHLLRALADEPDDDWRQHAACHPDNRPDHWNEHDPRTLTPEQWTTVFFPPTGGSVNPARKICGQCPVVADCAIQAAEDHEIHGIWGGQPASVRLKSRMADDAHGTAAGCNRHYREGTTPCGPCMAAKANYNRVRKARRNAAA